MRIVFATVLALASTVAHADPFDVAYESMVRGDFAGAAAGFHAIATSGDGSQRESAAALARLADELVRRGARLETAHAPGFEAPLLTTAISEDDAEDGGRAGFVVTTTLASLYSGVVLVDLVDVDNVRDGTLVVMGTTAAGVAGSLFATRNRTMTSGMSDAWSLGLFSGLTNSLLLAGPLGLYRADSNASEKVQSFVLGTTWAGAATGLLIANRVRPTRAQVSVMETFSVMGIASTMMSFAIVQPDDLDGDLAMGLMAGGFDLGLGVGALFADKLDWSHSRARYVGLGSFLGALAGAGGSLVAFYDTEDENLARLSAGITLAGLWGGFALTTYLTRDMAPDFRFRTTRRSTAMVSPTLVNQSPGLAVSGTF